MATTSEYHDRIQREKREAILRAATDLFLELGYDGTSLAKVAATAGVSTATLFKRFPTKAVLFDAIVTGHWAVGEQPEEPPRTGDPRAGLRTIGLRYADLMTRPEMVALFRIVIAEVPRFPSSAGATSRSASSRSGTPFGPTSRPSRRRARCASRTPRSPRPTSWG